MPGFTASPVPPPLEVVGSAPLRVTEVALVPDWVARVTEVALVTEVAPPA